MKHRSRGSKLRCGIHANDGAQAMSSIFPRTTPAAARAAAPVASRETHEAARFAVRDLLERAQSFNELAPEKREALAKGLVQIGSYLAEPEGVRVKPSAQVRALA